MKKKTSPILAVLLLVVVIVLMLVGKTVIERYIPSKEKADIKEYFQLTEAEDTGVILDFEKQDTTAKLVAGKIYVEYQFLHDALNERFYWDANENKLLYTTPSEVISVEAGASDYYASKERHSENYTIVYADADKAYVALDFAKNYTNMDYKVFKKPNRIMITHTWGEVTTASMKKDAPLRVKGGIKSPILKELKKGDLITVVEEGKKWTKIGTEDGYIGYVKNRQIGKTKKKTLKSDFKEPEFKHILRDKKINMAWHQVTEQSANSSLAQVLSSTKGVNVISPTWFYLNDSQGGIHSLASSDYVNYAHQHEVEVWGLVSNLENPDVDTTQVLTHTSYRENLTNNLISMAIQYDLDGINVDMEALSADVGDGYIQFIRELSVKCEKNDIVLSVDNYVPSSYTAFYNRAEQALFADYIVIMGYDEHYKGSEKAGSVASIDFVKKGINDTLKEVPVEQTILGIPFYTRLWAETPKEDGKVEVTSEVVRMNAQQTVIDNSGETPKWSDQYGQYYLEYTKDGVTYKMWMEEDKSIEQKLKAMKKAELAGSSAWKLGMENPSVWDTIIKYVN